MLLEIVFSYIQGKSDDLGIIRDYLSIDCPDPRAKSFALYDSPSFGELYSLVSLFGSRKERKEFSRVWRSVIRMRHISDYHLVGRGSTVPYRFINKGYFRTRMMRHRQIVSNPVIGLLGLTNRIGHLFDLALGQVAKQSHTETR